MKVLQWKQQFIGARKATQLPVTLPLKPSASPGWAVREAVEVFHRGLGEPRPISETVEP